MRVIIIIFFLFCRTLGSLGSSEDDSNRLAVKKRKASRTLPERRVATALSCNFFFSDVSEIAKLVRAHGAELLQVGWQ